MKNLILILLILTGTVIQAQAFELNNPSLYLKNNETDLYNGIKADAVKRWRNDERMVIITINNQSNALMEMGKLGEEKNFDENIMFKAMDKWKTPNGFNYEMVVFSYKKQMEAKNRI